MYYGLHRLKLNSLICLPRTDQKSDDAMKCGAATRNTPYDPSCTELFVDATLIAEGIPVLLAFLAFLAAFYFLSASLMCSFFKTLALQIPTAANFYKNMNFLHQMQMIQPKLETRPGIGLIVTSGRIGRQPTLPLVKVKAENSRMQVHCIAFINNQ